MSIPIITSDKLSAQQIAEMRAIDPNDKHRLLWNDDQYFADTTMTTNSHLKVLKDGGPLALIKYLAEVGIKKEKTEAQIYGSAFHCAVLEPNEFYKRFYVLDDKEACKKIIADSKITNPKKPVSSPRATNAYAEWKAEFLLKHEGKDELSFFDYDNLMRLKDRVYSLSQCRQLLEHNLNEVVYQREIEGVKCKVKADSLRLGSFGLDLKSMTDAPTPQNFRRTMENYGYDQQAAFYMDVLGVKEFWFVACEKTSPYSVGVFRVSKETYMTGKAKYLYQLRQHKAYFNGPQKIDPATFLFTGEI